MWKKLFQLSWSFQFLSRLKSVALVGINSSSGSGICSTYFMLLPMNTYPLGTFFQESKNFFFLSVRRPLFALPKLRNSEVCKKSVIFLKEPDLTFRINNCKQSN